MNEHIIRMNLTAQRLEAMGCRDLAKFFRKVIYSAALAQKGGE